ncbi:hypothetical protein SAMD00023353_3100250 [Rosellinia necatrix]|uniref:Uncharacterized protein n=1 Tax=Rosellinia necatrix TaxID=77044 RepID=A0A1S8A916_ROSNE|nr:hypothetical protein SAMD00023353_3100250 [Rosellinia necatrix]
MLADLSKLAPTLTSFAPYRMATVDEWVREGEWASGLGARGACGPSPKDRRAFAPE